MKYSDQSVPDWYRCSACGKSGVKLMRESGVFLDHIELRCIPCTTAAGIAGWSVAAVPDEEEQSYWGLSSVPQDGCDWYNRLPE